MILTMHRWGSVSRTGNDRPAILHCGWPQQNPEWALAKENGLHTADVAALEQIRIDDRVRRWRMKQPDGSSVSGKIFSLSIRHSSDTTSLTLFEVSHCVKLHKLHYNTNSSKP